MDEQQRQAFKRAVEKKEQAARAVKPPHGHAPHSIESHAPGEHSEQSIRDKTKGHDKRSTG